MNANNEISLRLGPDVIQKLLPHRRPFLMVDRIETFLRAPVPQLRASRFVSANEEVFSGHFPGLHLWPGVYTIEGLGQTTNLLQTLLGFLDGFEAAGLSAEDVLEGLRQLEASYTLRGGPPSDKVTLLLQHLRDPMRFMGFSAVVNVKLLAPVFAGQRLDYCARRTHTAGDLIRSEVEAEVDGRVVARGSMDSIVKIVAPPSG
jgi:3-hydroxyacyl-[acyl-carrier-protein] dehydratase